MKVVHGVQLFLGTFCQNPGGSAAADSSNSANTHTCKAKKEQIVIVIPSSLPPGSMPPLHPHPCNVVTIISTPGIAYLTNERSP